MLSRTSTSDFPESSDEEPDAECCSKSAIVTDIFVSDTFFYFIATSREYFPLLISSASPRHFSNGVLLICRRRGSLGLVSVYEGMISFGGGGWDDILGFLSNLATRDRVIEGCVSSISFFLSS
jgi:hypothetical protein